jgi:hypothetical protein
MLEAVSSVRMHMVHNLARINESLARLRSHFLATLPIVSICVFAKSSINANTYSCQVIKNMSLSAAAAAAQDHRRQHLFVDND